MVHWFILPNDFLYHLGSEHLDHSSPMEEPSRAIIGSDSGGCFRSYWCRSVADLGPRQILLGPAISRSRMRTVPDSGGHTVRLESRLARRPGHRPDRCSQMRKRETTWDRRNAANHPCHNLSISIRASKSKTTPTTRSIHGNKTPKTKQTATVRASAERFRINEPTFPMV